MEKRRNFYGRLRGQHLKTSQQKLLDERLPVFHINRLRKDQALGFTTENRPIWMEIGFGGGEHLAHLARTNPDIAIIGAEPYVNGVAQLLSKLEAKDCERVYIHDWDVRALFDDMPDRLLERAYLLYPDPWPKTRHHRRRFVTPDHLLPLARVMKPGAKLYLATDIPDYVRQALEEIPKAGFAWTAQNAADWRNPWPNWTRTRYEAKALREGRSPHYLIFERV